MNNEKTYSTFMAILIVFLGIFALLAYMAYVGGREEGTDLAVEAVEEALATSSASSVATTTSESGDEAETQPAAKAVAPKQPAASVSQAAVASVPVQAVESPRAAGSASSAPPEPNGRLCTANDLTGRATWERTGTYLIGTIRIRNSSESDCVLSRASGVRVFSGFEALSDRQTSGPSAGMLLGEGEERPVYFTWYNWCGGALRDPAHVIFSLPGSAGYLKIPLISRLGDPQYDVPRCDSSASLSTVDVWW